MRLSTPSTESLVKQKEQDKLVNDNGAAYSLSLSKPSESSIQADLLFDVRHQVGGKIAGRKNALWRIFSYKQKPLFGQPRKYHAHHFTEIFASNVLFKSKERSL